MPSQTSQTGKLVVGKITGVYGVKGWVKVYSYTDPREGISKYNPWYLNKADSGSSSWRKADLEKVKKHGKTVIAKLADCDDRDAAMLLAGTEIAIEESQLMSLDTNEYYWRDLVGLVVINQQGNTLGTVKTLMETGANDVLVVEAASGGEILIPWTLGHAVVSIDKKAGVISVDWQLEWSQDEAQDEQIEETK